MGLIEKIFGSYSEKEIKGIQVKKKKKKEVKLSL